MNKPPKHAFEVTIRIGGDDWAYVERVIDDLADHIVEHGPECTMMSGGAGGCHSVEIERRDIAPEAYHAELEAWSSSLPPAASASSENDSVVAARKDE